MLFLPASCNSALSSNGMKTNNNNNNSLRQLAHRRHKRDFMFAVGNSTDPMPSCFQDCNREWRQDFQRELGLNATDFYDFPFHPKVLDYSSFLAYCRLADRQTQCFINRCGDQSADRVFSPSNFLCTFKRQHFLRARGCLEESEPISFLRCDQSCPPGQGGKDKGGKGGKGAAGAYQRAELGKVFSESEIDGYERELDTLCTFQQCYSKCNEDIVGQICPPGQAAIASELLRTYLQWHSADLLDWHILTGNERRLPRSCSQMVTLELGGNNRNAGDGQQQQQLEKMRRKNGGGEEEEEDVEKTKADPVLMAMASA